jgi:hypothetical protein
VHLVVGARDGVADTVVGTPSLDLEAAAYLTQSGFGGSVASRMSSDAVDDNEYAAGSVVVKAVLVGVAEKARMRVPGSP